MPTLFLDHMTQLHVQRHAHTHTQLYTHTQIYKRQLNNMGFKEKRGLELGGYEGHKERGESTDKAISKVGI